MSTRSGESALRAAIRRDSKICTDIFASYPRRLSEWKITAFGSWDKALASVCNVSGAPFRRATTSAKLKRSRIVLQFKYDPFGRRIEKILPTTTSIFAYDGDNLVETVNGSGGVVARYTQGHNTDESLAMERGSTTSFFEADGLGSVTSLTNAAGTVAQSYTYDPTIRLETRRRPPVRSRTTSVTPLASSTPKRTFITTAPDTTIRAQGGS
jgi:YD repeat-containing protein